MHKIYLNAFLLCLSYTGYAQSNLIINELSIPLNLQSQTLGLTEETTTIITIPSPGTVDTVITFNPETYGMILRLVASKPQQSTETVKTIKASLNRKQFFENPLFYLVQNGQECPPYKLIIYYFLNGEFKGLGFDNEAIFDFSSYSLRYFKNTTLEDFRYIIQTEFPKELTEFYIAEIDFLSIETKEKLRLSDAFCIKLKD